jgi:hypothetical protein
MALSPPPLFLKRNARIEVRRIGKEQQPVFIVDEAFDGCEDLMKFAAQSAFVTPAAGSYYPGLNAHLPTNYLPLLLAALERPLTEIFDAIPGRLGHAYGFFGLTNLSPAQMVVRQGLPHTDSANARSFATVHYLNADFGGTAFYRHRATGFEVVSNIRAHEFKTVRTQEIKRHDGQPRETLNALYEEIAHVEPAFNRLIVYRATQLHAMRLENTDALNNSPATGRLTANTFLNT